MTARTVSSALVISIVLLMMGVSGQTVSSVSAAPEMELASTDEATSWKIYTIDAVGNVGQYTSLALDSEDNVHISYYDVSHGDLKYATNASGQWVVSKVDPGKNVGLYTSLALDSNDKAHISYYDETSGYLKYCTNAGGLWKNFIIDSGGDVGQWTSLALDSGDNVHISYIDVTNQDLKYATNAGGSWKTLTIDSANIGSRTSLAIDSEDWVHISYRDRPSFLGNDIKYATNVGGSWETSWVDNRWADTSWPSLAIDSNDNVHISYCDFTYRYLKYATNVGGSWIISTACSDFTGWASLALDSLDKAHISYTGDHLMYATNAEGSWTISTVDSDSLWGGSSSIEVDSNDRVHISYYEEGNWDLRYATNAGPAIPGPPSKVVLYNGIVLTMEESMPMAEAIAVDGDCIVAVGTNENILAMVDDDTCVIDLCGRTVLPGFIDSHTHVITMFYQANIGPPYERGQRWVPAFLLTNGDSSSKRATPQDAVQAVLKGGWTSISDMFVDQGRLGLLRGLDDAGELGVRVNAYLPLNWQFERFGDWYKAYAPGQEFSSKLRIAGLKIYTDDGMYGQSVYFGQDELTALVSKVHSEGYQTAIHAVDAGIDLTINALEEALDGEPNSMRRHRVEHLCVLHDDQLNRIKDLGLVASIQMTFFTSNPWDLWDTKKGFGHEGVELVGRWNDIIEADIPSIGSTDCPSFSGTNISAMATIYKAVTRIGWPAAPVPQWELDQRITVGQALRLLTIDAAYGTFQEDVKGSIAVGKYADLVILSENPLAVDPERLMDVCVLMTMVGGQVEYCAPGHEYLYGTVVEAPDALSCETFSDTTLPTSTEEWVATTEAIWSSKVGT